MRHKTLSAVLVFIVFLITASFFSNSRAAGVVKYLSGYAWSSNIGWISFSGVNPNYYVYLNNYDPVTPSYLNGYAWSSNIGWINFGCGRLDPSVGNTTQTKLCSEDNVSGTAPAYPTGGEIASGPVLAPDNKLKGWARACSVFESGCSGPLKNDFVRGGWDGWVSLSGLTTGGAPYGGVFDSATKRFSGFAWAGGVELDLSSNNVSPQFPGWISLSGSNYAVSMLDSLPNNNTRSVSCTHSPSVINVGATVNWTASIIPADGVAHTYVWTGSGITSGQGTDTITVTYGTPGSVSAPSVTIDSNSLLISDCGGSITIGPKEFTVIPSGSMSARFVRSINSTTIPATVSIAVGKPAGQVSSFGSTVDITFHHISYNVDNSIKAGVGASSPSTLLVTPIFTKAPTSGPFVNLDPDQAESATIVLQLTKNQDPGVSDTSLSTGDYTVVLLATPRSGGSIKTVSIPLQIDNPSGRVRQL
ncbi:MAG: hypothetical protein HZA94_02985 [Candidatus Vogelbacteria bacterium]|nr:hypothetical protein [Candidatus Vogelbacteria bacterium]